MGEAEEDCREGRQGGEVGAAEAVEALGEGRVRDRGFRETAQGGFFWSVVTGKKAGSHFLRLRNGVRKYI